MYIDPRHPGIMKYRAARAADTERAIARKKAIQAIMQKNPKISEQEALKIYQESQKKAG